MFGGVAIATAVLLVSATQADVSRLWVLMLGGGVIFLVGLVDDVISLKPYSKLIAEIAVASLFVFFGLRLNWSDSLTHRRALDDGVDCRFDERVQSARQHGWPVCRRRA